jgi:hypothetical protein
MSKVEELALDTKGCVVSYSSSSYGDYNGCSSKIIDGLVMLTLAFLDKWLL